MANDHQNVSLYVGNLHAECTESELYKKFITVGDISSVRICRDIATGKSLGYGYVNYKKPEDARQAMEMLNYDLLNGQVLRIMWAKKDVKSFLIRKANLVVKNLSKVIDDKMLRDVFVSFGTILSVKVAANAATGDSKGYGFVQFENEESAQLAVLMLNGSLLHGKKITVTQFIPFEERKRFQEQSYPNNVYVKNLTPKVTGEDLEQLCASFGDIISAKIVLNEDKKSKEYGFVNFASADGANKAVQQLNLIYLNGRRLYAKIASPNSISEDGC